MEMHMEPARRMYFINLHELQQSLALASAALAPPPVSPYLRGTS